MATPLRHVRAEIVTIGDEILYGQITDTNSQWMSAELDLIGVRTVRKSAIGDDEGDILAMLAEAEARADIILITGGLGPTKDDITKRTLARYFDSDLVMNETALAQVTDFFERRGRAMTELNRQQALQPRKAQYVPNPVGTAPGMWFEKDNKIFVSMPGVPHEMKEMMRSQVIPRLRAFFDAPIIYHKIVRTIGIGESFLAQKIEAWEDALPPHIRLAYLPNLGQVRLRLTAVGDNLEILQDEVAAQVAQLQVLIPKYIFGYDGEEIEWAVGQLLRAQGQTLATAESCTGGYLGHLLTRVPGSSDYYQGGVVAYSNDLKTALLDVPAETLQTEGAVSEATACAMATGVRTRLGTDHGIASTGVAGPGGGSDQKPVGTVWIAIADAHDVVARKLLLTGDRRLNIELTAVAALNLLRQRLRGFL